MSDQIPGDPAAPAIANKPEYWCVVALDYDKDKAWIVAMSNDARERDILEGDVATCDNNIDDSWMKGLEPGLYRLRLKPWAYQGYFLDWECGIDVKAAELLVAFPPLNAQGLPLPPAPEDGGASPLSTQEFTMKRSLP